MNENDLQQSLFARSYTILLVNTKTMKKKPYYVEFRI